MPPTSAIDYGIRHNKLHVAFLDLSALLSPTLWGLYTSTWRLPWPGICRNEAPPNATTRMICATTYPCATPTATTSVCHAAAGTCSIGMPLSTVSARHSVCEALAPRVVLYGVEGAAQTNLGWLQIWKEKKWNFIRSVSVSFVRAVNVSSGWDTLCALSPRTEMTEPGAPLTAAASRATTGSTTSPSC